MTNSALANPNKRKKITTNEILNQSLWKALSEDNYKHAQDLVLTGAKVNIKNKEGKTPLHYAAISKNADIDFIDFLIEKGADVNAKNRQGETPIHLATISTREEADSYKIIQLLVDNDAGMLESNKNGDTPLHYAAMSGSAKIMCYFLLKRCNKDIENSDGFTPLHLAAIYDKPAMAEFLLINGAKMSLSKAGTTPLYHAFKADSGGVIYFILNRKPNLNQELKVAIRKGDEEFAKMLFSKCVVELDESDEELFDLLYMAFKAGNENIIDLLTEKKLDFSLGLKIASLKNDKEFAEILINKGKIGPEGLNKDSNLPLHFASIYSNTEMVEFLIEKNANILAQDKMEKTALHWAAAMQTDINIIKALVDNKSDVNAQDKKGNTPLHLAVTNICGKNISKDLVEFLIQHEACVDIKNIQEKTALDLANDFENIEVVRFLNNFTDEESSKDEVETSGAYNIFTNV